MALGKVGGNQLETTLNIDSGTLYVDGTNNRVGVGTVSPPQKFVVSNAGADNIVMSENTSSSLQLFMQAQNGVGAVGTLTNHDTVLLSNNTERMRINSSGNVGIGKSTGITDKLHIENTGANCLLSVARTDGAAGRLVMQHTSSVGALQTTGSVDLLLGTNDLERMRIDSSGRVRINRTTGLYTEQFLVESDGSTVNPMTVNNTRSTAASDYAIIFGRAGSIVGSIQTSLSATSYVTTSDYRLKTNVNYDWDATSRLKQLKPARFEWISDGDDAVPVDGFLAHEVQDIVPEAISGTKDGVDVEGNPEYQGIDQSKLTPLLTKALIEAVEKIEQLEARIIALESA